jgi:trehalose-6-phosphate synthase
MIPALWPLFHYLLWQDVSPTSLSASFSADEHWAPYEQANTTFARRILDIYRPGDLIWVHDYHLLLVPKLLRLLVPDIFVGLFVHTPWPSSEVFRCLPRMYTIFLHRIGVDILTYQGERRFWMACSVQTLYVSRLIRIPGTLRHPAYEYVDMKLLRAVSMSKATSRLSCTLLSESTRIVSRVTCELSPSFRFRMNTQISSQYSSRY